MASLLVHAIRAKRRPHLPPEAWIADEEDQEAIGAPLARIIARRSPIGEGSSDAIDGIEALLGTTNYAMKGITLEQAVDADHEPQPVPGEEEAPTWQ